MCIIVSKEFTAKTSGKLFESSEDEPDTAEDDDDRFKIKPQFEGKAGEKVGKTSLSVHIGAE